MICVRYRKANGWCFTLAIGRKNWPFTGSERGGRSAAIAYTLIATAKLNGVDPQAWLTDVLGRLADHKMTRLDELMPWSYADVTVRGISNTTSEHFD